MKTVLLLDDDGDFRTMIATALREAGMSTLEAARRSQADEILAAESVDFVVVDGLLPDGPGLQWIEQRRRIDPDIALAFISSFWRDMETFNRLTRELGVALVLYKPVVVGEVVSRIAEVLGVDVPAATSAGQLESSPAVVHATWSASMPAAQQDGFAALRQDYAARLPGKLLELEQAIAAAISDPRQADEAHALAHRLRGTAGSYGFAGVGRIAGRVEDLLLDAKDGQTPTRRNFWHEILVLVRDAKLIVAREPSSGLGVEGDEEYRPHSVLVVDDDEDFLRLVRSYGPRALVDVRTAGDRREALKIAADCPLVGAIVDVQLDHENAFAMVADLRRATKQPRLPVAFVSADHRIDTRAAAALAGALRFLDKPLGQEAFAAVVQQFVRRSAERAGRVFIVDPDAEMVGEYARALLPLNVEVEAIDDLQKLMDRLSEAPPDVLLLALRLPHISGLDLCRALRMSAHLDLLPIVMLSPVADTQTRLEVFRAGASDLILKPVIAEELRSRIATHLERVALIRDRAERDALSGLLLRRPFIDSLQRALATCTRDHKPLSLVVIDLDHFKQINDTHGHLAGDQVIAQFGELLAQRFRTEDLRGRWGGEEFILAFPGATAAFAHQAATRLLEDLQKVEFRAESGQTFRASFTAGVALWPDDAGTMNGLVQVADERLYQGKREGRGRVCHPEPRQVA